MKSLSKLKRKQPVELYAAGELNFDGNTNETIPKACSVTALYRQDANPAANTLVRFKVLTGPLEFLSGNKTEAKIKTDAEGKASVDARFKSKGFAIVVAQLVDNPKVSVFFRGHSDGVTHQLFLHTESCVSVNPGKVKARIVALDRRGFPSIGAHIHFEGTQGGDEVIEGKVKELGDGEYEGIFQTHLAGDWTLMVQDTDTHVFAHAMAHLIPGSPHTFRFIGETDPRASQPYGEILLRARLEDKFGNALDPHRINCAADGKKLSPRAHYGTEAQFPISLAGFGKVNAQIFDSESKKAKNIAVKFASAWLQDPGAIFAGSSFKTGLYWVPSLERPVNQANIEIAFDSKLVSFKNIEKSSKSPVVLSEVKITRNMITIPVRSEELIEAGKYPQGVYIGDICWECLGEGETCFKVSAIMSPRTPGWNLCPVQKNQEANRKCLCINVIYKPGDANGKTKGETVAEQVESVISSALNVKKCCPVVKVKVSTHEMTADEWNSLNTDIGGDGAVSGIPDKLKINASPVGKKANCINLYMIPFNASGTLKGLTTLGGPNSVIDPSVVGVRTNVGAHEMGHALGLDHTSAGGDRNNLMSNQGPDYNHGHKLVKDQCRKIWENIDKYPCQ